MQETSINENQNLSAKSSSYHKTGIILLIVGIVLLIAIIVFSFFSLTQNQIKKPQAWKAVFLINGQSYFGHIAKQTKTEIVLHDVYYLQLRQVPAKKGETKPSQQLSIVKLGQETYGPENMMTINRSQVLFVEQLREDSQIVKKIQSLTK